MSRLSAVLLVAALGAVACKKKVPDPPPPDPVPVQKVEAKLQITSVTPSTVDADKATTGKVYGGGFKAGATVKFNDRSASKTTVVDPNTLDVDIPALPAGAYDVTVTNPDGGTTVLRSGLTARSMADESCRQATVFFDFDSAGLKSDAKGLLDRNNRCYQQKTGTIRVAGHADERGTTDYNLALGQRRADSVRVHLANQGVAGSRIQTVSYGEERPAARGSNESAWAKNRRAEITAE